MESKARIVMETLAAMFLFLLTNDSDSKLEGFVPK